MRRREVVHVLHHDSPTREVDWLPGERVVSIERDGSVKELDVPNIIRESHGYAAFCE